MKAPSRKSTQTNPAGDPEREAFAHLKRIAPKLYAAALPHRGTILTRLAPKRTSNELFAALVSSITSQQLSTKAAASIYARVTANIGGKMTPAAVAATTTFLLRSSGLSEAKVRSVYELAEAILEKRINLLALRNVTAEEAVKQLTSLRGIGPWTAEMFLIFAVGSPDIFSPGDLILARRMQKLLNLPENISKKEMYRLAEAWTPHRTFVSLLFWKLHHAEKT